MDSSGELPPGLARWLAERGGGASRAQLMARGSTSVDLARYLRHGTLRRVRRGYYALVSPDPPLDRWEEARRHHLGAAASLSARDVVAGLRTGSLVWGLPVCAIPKAPEFVRPPGTTRIAGTRVVLSQLDPSDVVRHNGIWVTSLVRTAVDVSLDLAIPESLITLDGAVRGGVRQDLLLEHLSNRGPVRHLRRARTALQWADPHVESPLESRCRGELLLDAVPPPACNLPLRLGGREIRPDLLWLELGIAVEVDGRGKYDEPESLWREKRRQEWMESELGLIVLRFTNAEIVGDPRECSRRWRKAEARRGVMPWERPSGLEVKVRGPR